jgi:hypothetical protein
MKAYCLEKNLLGFANWFDVQVQEEHAHAMGMYDYVVERGGRVILEAIEKPEYNITEILLGPRRDKASIYPVGHPVICGECGTEGGLHKDVMEWKDKDGLWHYTHYDCVNNYVDRTGYTPYNPSAILH